MDLREIHTLWFEHPEWWFNAPPEVDRFLEEKFTKWIESAHRYISFDLQVRHEFTSKEEYVGLIILFDQIPRHAYRTTYGAHCVQYYLQYAVHYAEYFSHRYEYGQLNAYEWSFVKLPWRHAENIWMIRNTMSDIWQKLHIAKFTPKCPKELAHLRRFLRATYERYPFHIYHELDYIPYVLHEKSLFENEDGYRMYKDLLAYCPETIALREPNNSIKKTQLWSTIATQIHHKKNYIISLSGGIDSMVCTYTTALKLREHMKHINICAVHINYSNRPECSQEEDFLRDWCRFIDIPLYIRRIDEIHRKESMHEELRETYETYTRNVRYATYKHVWNKYFCIENNNALPQVILGHNKDDCFENILTNITHCSKYDNLEGMSAEGVQDGISFIRPFLKIPKADIYKFSRDYNIPHLATSTPNWSMRGQIRDNVKPELAKWNPSIIQGLHELSDRMGELNQILIIYVDMHLEKLQNQNGCIEFTNAAEILESQIYWKTLIYKYSGCLPSVKSIVSLVSHIRRFKSNRTDSISIKINVRCHIRIHNVHNVKITCSFV
jgi:tRNA(Ile)-lysidine synthetase-like protein